MGLAWVDLPLTAFWFVGYFAFFATSLWLKAGRRARWFPPVRAYGVAARAARRPWSHCSGRTCSGGRPHSWLPLGVGLWAAAHRRDRDLLAGLATVAGSALMTVVAFDAGKQRPADPRLAAGAGPAPLLRRHRLLRQDRDPRARQPGFLRVSVTFHAVATARGPGHSSPWLTAVFLRSPRAPRPSSAPATDPRSRSASGDRRHRARRRRVAAHPLIVEWRLVAC